MNRELRAALGLLLLGAVLVLLGVRHDWGTVPDPSALTIDEVRTGIRGIEVAALAQSLGWLGLAGVAAVVATRGWARLLVGILLTLAGDVVVVRVALLLDGLARELGGTGRDAAEVHVLWAWPVLTLVGGALLAAGGAVVTARGRRWAALSSSYAPPAAQAPPPATDKGVWDALDRGDDPTA